MKRLAKGLVVTLICYPLLGCASNKKSEEQKTSSRTTQERPIRKPSAQGSRMSGSSTAAMGGQGMGSESTSAMSGSSTSAPIRSESAYYKGRMDQCMQMQPTEKMCADQLVLECQKRNPSADCQALFNPGRTPTM